MKFTRGILKLQTARTHIMQLLRALPVIVFASALLVGTTSLASAFTSPLNKAFLDSSRILKVDTTLCSTRPGSELSRREMFSIATSLTTLATTSSIARADDTSTDANERILIRGKVSLKSDDGFPEDTTSSALYITARPNKPDNVPKAILDGSNGKPPPVLAARIPNPQFPFEFSLSTADLTLEGASKLESAVNVYWFEGQDLIISARWDTDGVASTRDPTDLVGRSQYVASKGDGVMLQIGGRGLTGKLITGKAKK